MKPTPNMPKAALPVVNDLERDSFEKHIEDTLIAGDGLCNKEVVEIVVKEGPARVQEIIEWGALFDKDAEGDYKLGMEGGHSQFRILHYKDVTGKEMERALLEAVDRAPNITFIKHCFVIDIITQHHLGLPRYQSHTGHLLLRRVCAEHRKPPHRKNHFKSEPCWPPAATGRCTAPPPIPTLPPAMAWRWCTAPKGGSRTWSSSSFTLRPCTKPASAGRRFLITEAVRGDGGILRNKKGDAFMPWYDKRKDLAPRDIVARAIDSEMKKDGTEHVWLDCRHMDIKKFRDHFPNIYEKCLSIGIDVAINMIPIAPAAHYSCGGIKTDEWGRSSIHNLYACGECASTGLHGANRLASNSLLEAMVFAHRCYADAVKHIDDVKIFPAIPDWNAEGTSDPKEMILITQSLKELQQVMSDYVGIVRNTVRLERAMKRIDLLFDETEHLYQTTSVSPHLLELRNMISVGYLITKGAAFRKESRGLHFTTDYPDKSELVENIVL
jgi:L-aspartate oxidase